MKKVFLSYARADDEAFVARLYSDLTQHGFEVWWDRKRMPSRGLTFLHEIRDAINDCERFVLVFGPHAGTSDYVSAEWQHALAYGKPITPVLRLGGYESLPSELRLLHTEDFRKEEEYGSHLEQLIQQLSEPVPQLGSLIGAPRLPQPLWARPDHIRSLRELILADVLHPTVLNETTSVTGVQGMGGIGKSVLANLLARDVEVRRAFSDGIIWVPIGRDPNLVELQRNIAKAFIKNPEPVENTYQGRADLVKNLRGKAVLLILDDAWDRKHVEVFLGLGPRCRVILTTRDKGLVRSLGGQHYPVQLPTESEALRLFADAAHITTEELPSEGREIVRECGCLPLAVALCGGMIRSGVSWQSVLTRLRAASLEHIRDRHAEHEYHRSLWSAIQVSVDALAATDRERFYELGVFFIGEGIPEDAVRLLWTHTGGLTDHACEDLLVELSERSLIRLDNSVIPAERDRGRRQVWLHDLLQDYVTRFTGDDVTGHQRLIDAYHSKCTGGWVTGPDDGYFFQRLVQHLVRSGRVAEAKTLLFDFRWLGAKLDCTPPTNLDQDCQILLRSVTLPALREEQSYLSFLSEFVAPLPSSNRLATLLWGHFANSTYPSLQELLKQAQTYSRQAWLRPITPSLAIEKSALIRTIEGIGFVESLAVGDTAHQDPIVAAVLGESPRRVCIWIGGMQTQSFLVEPQLDDSRRGVRDYAVKALNLPNDLRPVLQFTWTESVRGTCCRLVDLSMANQDFAGRFSTLLNRLAVDTEYSNDSPFVGPVMALTKGEPMAIGMIEGRQVLVVSFPREYPQFFCSSRGQLKLVDLFSVIDQETLAEYKELVWHNSGLSEFGDDYIRRLRRLADKLTTVLGEQVYMKPEQVLPPRIMLWDTKTGQRIPDRVWSIPDSFQPLLVGESLEREPFLMVSNIEGRSLICKPGSTEPTPMSWMSFAINAALSRRHNRLVIVKGGFGGVEVVDVSTLEIVGRFSKHLDEVTILAATKGMDGNHLIASAGRLGSRGRFSTSVRIWDVDTQKQVAPTGTAHTAEIKTITAGNYRGNPVFATGSWGLICIWRAEAISGFSIESEGKRISDPNLCGRIPLEQLPPGYRHHDLGAVCFQNERHILTWGATRSDAESLDSTRNEWINSSAGSGQHQPTITFQPRQVNPQSQIESVKLLTGEGTFPVIVTGRLDGTQREWRFSPRADWEHQHSDLHYWHCISVSSALVNGRRISIRVGYYGDVVIEYEENLERMRLVFDPGCPATQCALGEDGQTLVIFDERGTAHHLELVLPAD